MTSKKQKIHSFVGNIADGAYVPRLFVGMYAPLGWLSPAGSHAEAQTCQRTARQRHPPGDEEWPFAEAPRWMCIESVGKLPELFEDLIKRTEEATEKIKGKTSEAKEFLAAVRAIASEISPKAGKTK